MLVPGSCRIGKELGWISAALLSPVFVSQRREAKLEFLGGGEGAKQKPSVGGMDICWNCTL